jgi:TetR/AcrR family transcriptional repressor of nem operon
VSIAIRKGQRTRGTIIRKAASVFNQRGYAGTSMADLMETTGLEKGGIYRHFQSKEELAVAAFDYAWTETKRGHRKGLESLHTAPAKLHAMIDNFVDKVHCLPGGCPLLNTATDADDGNLALRAHAQAALDEWFALIERTLRDGIERGELVKDISPREVATILISTLEGSVMISRLNGDRAARQIVCQHLSRFIDGLVVPVR